MEKKLRRFCQPFWCAQRKKGSAWWFSCRLIRAQPHCFRHSFCLLLFHGLPPFELRLLGSNFIQVAFNSLQRLCRNPVQFRLNQSIPLGFSLPVILELPPLAGLIGIQSLLALPGVAHNFFNGNSAASSAIRTAALFASSGKLRM